MPRCGNLSVMSRLRCGGILVHEVREDFMHKHHRLLTNVTAHVVAGIVMALLLPGASATAEDAYPSRPVRMIVPFAAGGPTDIVGRIMGARMGEVLGQQFIIENKNGAGGNIGAED